MNLTKSVIEKLSIPEKIGEGRTGQKKYYDDKLKGFGLRVTSGGTKAFFVEKLIQGKLRRITLGHYPDLTVESARKEAHILLGKIAKGIDPVAVKNIQQLKGVTLGEAFNDYLKVRGSLKSTTRLEYQQILSQVVPDWLDKPLVSINRDLVAKRHAEYGEAKSRARANYGMRLLRAVFNFAINQYQAPNGEHLILDNPVSRLSHTRAWYKIERKQSVIKSHQLSAWYNGLIELPESFPKKSALIWHDYFLFILFTGLRQHEAASLTWNNVDLIAKTFQLIDTKNRSTHILPMSDFVYTVFQRRRQATETNFVFPADSKEGYVADHRKAMWKVTELSGVEFKLHDLRRTFITVAESLDISAYSLKRLLNHKMNSDVTSGYIISDVERLRKPMQQVTDYLLKCIKY